MYFEVGKDLGIGGEILRVDEEPLDCLFLGDDPRGDRVVAHLDVPFVAVEGVHGDLDALQEMRDQSRGEERGWEKEDRWDG